MQKAIDYFGTSHIVINNAGKFQHKSLNDITLDEWNDMLQTNLTSFSRYHGIGKGVFM